jgi:hypothetical protein
LIERLAQRRAQRVRVYFGTQRVTVELSTGARRPQPLRSTSQPIDAAGGLDAALAALGEAMGALRAGTGDLRGLACEVVLADGWIVYDVVALDLLRISSPAAGVAVTATLEDVAGAHPGSLAVRWQWQHDGRGVFAMAVPRVMLGKLKATTAGAGLVLKSVTGEFLSVYNAQRSAITGRRVVFAVGREGGAQIAVLSDGVIRATRFELGGTGGNRLSRAAAGVMRARGEDTTAPTEYVLDATSDDGPEPHDPRWARLRSPADRKLRRDGALKRLKVPQRLALDFVAPPAPAGVGRLLLALSLLALFAGGAQVVLAWQAYQHEKAELASVAQRGATPVSAGARRGAPNAAGLQSADAVARGLTAPWSDLMQSIETIQNKDVALQVIEPIAARQSLRITADGRHPEAMLDYLQQLQGRTLTEVVLTSHQVQVQQPGAPIRFQVQAKWGGAVAPNVPGVPAATQASNAEPARGLR